MVVCLCIVVWLCIVVGWSLVACLGGVREQFGDRVGLFGWNCVTSSAQHASYMAYDVFVSPLFDTCCYLLLIVGEFSYKQWPAINQSTSQPEEERRA